MGSGSWGCSAPRSLEIAAASVSTPASIHDGSKCGWVRGRPMKDHGSPGSSRHGGGPLASFCRQSSCRSSACNFWAFKGEVGADQPGTFLLSPARWKVGLVVNRLGLRGCGQHPLGDGAVRWKAPVSAHVIWTAYTYPDVWERKLHLIEARYLEVLLELATCSPALQQTSAGRRWRED